MASPDDKDKAQEKKFAHDSEMEFKVLARRNKLLGLWAAEKMHLSDDEAETYAKNLVVEGLQASGDENIVRKLANSFSEHGLEISEAAIHTRLGESTAEARDQILSDS